MEKSCNEIRFSLEKAHKIGKLKGRFINDSYEIPIGPGKITCGKCKVFKNLSIFMSSFKLGFDQPPNLKEGLC